MFGLVAAFLGIAANTISALNAPFSRLLPDEGERLREKLMSKALGNSAVLLLPRSIQRYGRFLWLAAHGSHVSHASHASHASHVSHASGTSSKSYTPSYTSPYTYSPWSYASPDYPIRADVINTVDLRKEPNISSPIIMTLNSNQEIIVVGYSESWVKVTVVVDGVTYTGWLSEGYIK